MLKVGPDDTISVSKNDLILLYFKNKIPNFYQLVFY